MCGECIGWIRASQLSFNSFCLVIKEIHVVLWYTDGRLCVFCQLIPDTFLLCYFQFGLIGIRYWLELIIWFSRKKVKVALSRPTLCYPMDHTDRGILQVRILEWVAIPFFRGSSQPRDQTQVSCTAGRFFTSWATREAQEQETRHQRRGCMPTLPELSISLGGDNEQIHQRPLHSTATETWCLSRETPRVGQREDDSGTP